MNESTKELIGAMVFFVFIFSGIQWLLIRFTHWSLALIATVLIAFIVSFLYVSYGNATPNGGSNGPPASEYISAFFVIFTCLMCGLTLVSFLSQNRMPKMVTIIPLGFIIAFGISRYVYQYLDNGTTSLNLFSSCKIELLNEAGESLIIKEITFMNSSNSIGTSMNPKWNEQPYPRFVRFADKIIFRNYSPKAQQSFQREFPFDYNLLKEKPGKSLGYIFWLRQKIVLPIKIVVKTNNKVHLFIDNHLVEEYDINEEEEQKKWYLN